MEEVVIALPEPRGELLDALIQACGRDARLIAPSPGPSFRSSPPEVSIGGLDGADAGRARQWRCAAGNALSSGPADIAVSGLGLVILSPVLLLVALSWSSWAQGAGAVHLVRVGLDGRPASRKGMIPGFRSMRVDAEAASGRCGPAKTIPAHHEAGHLHAWNSIDELPQLVNVLVGTSRPGGPRPRRRRPVFVDQFRQVVPLYMEAAHKKNGDD